MLMDLVLKNRSYRGFNRSVRIMRSDLLELVDLARLTASSLNNQVLKFKVVFEEADVERVQSLTLWALGLSELNLPYHGTEPTGFIVICLDRALMNEAVDYARDVGVAAQTMLLGAVEKGFGGCMIGSFDAALLGQTLNLPQTAEPNLVVAFGKPAEDVVLVPVRDGKTDYYRDDSGKTHYVPKRSLEEVLL